MVNRENKNGCKGSYEGYFHILFHFLRYCLNTLQWEFIRVLSVSIKIITNLKQKLLSICLGLGLADALKKGSFTVHPLEGRPGQVRRTSLGLC